MVHVGFVLYAQVAHFFFEGIATISLNFRFREVKSCLINLKLDTTSARFLYSNLDQAEGLFEPAQISQPIKILK